MAPAKANKRPTAGGMGSPKRKSRVEPMFAKIVATLQDADGINESTREMLIAMVSPSLSAAKGERHSVQQLGVTMIEEMLQSHKVKLVAAVDVAQNELAELEGSKGALMQCLEAAKASLGEKQTAKAAAHTAHEESKAATQAATSTVAAAIDTQTTMDAAHAGLEKDKADIDAAYLEHFKTRMDANECPQHSGLMPFLATLGLEESLISALPSSCVKTVDQRGGFDNLVLTELGKAFVGKIASLEKRIVDEAPGIFERKANIVNSESMLEARVLAEKTACSDLDAASVAQDEAEADVAKATEDWTTFEPQVQEATCKHTLQDTIRMDFEEGALKDFALLREKEAAAPEAMEEEAAPVGGA